MSTLVVQPPIILFVDDDPEAGTFLPRLIHSFAPGCEVVAVETGVAALVVIPARGGARDRRLSHARHEWRAARPRDDMLLIGHTGRV
jgi:hypothetical protein